MWSAPVYKRTFKSLKVKLFSVEDDIMNSNDFPFVQTVSHSVG